MVVIRLSNKETPFNCAKSALEFLKTCPGVNALLMILLSPGRYQVHFVNVSEGGEVRESFGQRRPVHQFLSI